MAQIIPCLRGKMGSTDFYCAKMTARELVNSARPASEIDEWAGMSIEERMQREVHLKRIREEIIPYLTKSADRLFGAVILLVYKGELTFEGISTVGAKVPAAYKTVADDIGFLMIDGGELIVLDGQHRLVSLREIIQGKDVDGEFVSAVPNDEISVIFIKHETSEKTRRIFNKVNRYAKPTSRGDNIITSEDDGYAIITRQLLDTGAPLGIKAGKDLIVNWKSNTLAANSPQLTTISAVYETVKDILDHHRIKDFDEKHRVNRPSEDELTMAYEHAEHWWRKVLDGLTPYHEALADTNQILTMRKQDQPYSLLFKPVGQIALFKGLIKAVERGTAIDQAVERANEIGWSITADHWREIIAKPDGKIIARAEAYELAAELIAYFIAPEKMDDQQLDALRRKFNEKRGYNYDDPKNTAEPEELPPPVTATATTQH